jgi:DNA-binding transcriptional regulator YdaS (Cro superfamily)
MTSWHETMRAAWGDSYALARSDQALIDAIVAAGGTARLAATIGVSSQAISQWDRVPVERVLQVERATNGQVSRQDLRPDIYPRETKAA